MRRLSVLILVFSVLFFIFFIALVFLRLPFKLYPLMSWQDVIDVFTPLVLIPLYFLLYRIDSKIPFGFSGLILYIVFAVFWVAGHGMHLSANSINNLLAQNGMETGNIYRLTYFLDEYLSHYIWHIGIVGLSALLIHRQWRNPCLEGKAMLWPIILGGLIYGFSYFLIVMEGNTAPLGVTFPILATLFIVIWARKGLGQQPIVTFFLISYALSILLFLIWGMMWGGLPPIMDVIKI
jgi:hypothetical protein